MCARATSPKGIQALVRLARYTSIYESVGPVNRKMGRLPPRTEAILADFLENVLLPSRRPRLASNRCGPNSVRPNHLSGHNFDHDYDFELPPEWRGSGAPHQVDGDLFHTMDVYGLPRVRTELPQLLVIPSSAPHPVQAQLPRCAARDAGPGVPAPARGIERKSMTPASKRLQFLAIANRLLTATTKTAPPRKSTRFAMIRVTDSPM